MDKQLLEEIWCRPWNKMWLETSTRLKEKVSINIWECFDNQLMGQLKRQIVDQLEEEAINE